MAKKPLEVDMIAGSQLRDSQGEMLSIEGADISDLMNGRGRLNDNHGKGFFNSIGRVTEAKKIFKADDCSNEREEYYWNKVKAPFIYVKGYLFDDEDHPNAKAAAAILRNIHKNDSPLQLKASVEGGVVSRGISDKTFLAKTKIHSVALTFTPANNNTLIEPLNLDKSSINEESDKLLIKSVMHLAKKEVPSFRQIIRNVSAEKIYDNLIKISETAGELGLDYINDFELPSKQEIIERSMEEKIATNVDKIHNIIVGKTNELQKDWKGALTGAAMGAALAGMPAATEAKVNIDQKPVAQQAPAIAKDAKSKKNKQPYFDNIPTFADVPKSPIEQITKLDTTKHQAKYKEIADKNPFLALSGEIESSKGKRLLHKTIKDPKSPHVGHSAGGSWGLMPNTVQLMFANYPHLKQKYPEIAEILKEFKPKEFFKKHMAITNKLNTDADFDSDIASTYFNFVVKNLEKNKIKLTPANLLYSWNRGAAAISNAIKNKKKLNIKNDQYVLKGLSILKRSGIAPRTPAQQIPTITAEPSSVLKMDKALMAGYGGASMPTNRVNGAVLQSESIDDRSDRFKYLTCDNCGKEQVYSKYQVKCRNCNKNFSLKKIFDILS